ncbi:oocyte zinc finger protein XlCOF7.1 isoform X1 [Pungitius pungitius]|uniref:oocyte zinc finger protein XlCOF7.1 isoform X1 n=2 Tax=Pungitius pungitius TaxID=134920 RepID=UPI002E15DDD0
MADFLASPWGAAAGMDQITVVMIDDTHIAQEQTHNGGRGKAVCYEMELSVPPEEEEVGEEEEEEEGGVYVIEYSNPEEEGESYQFSMSVDRLPARKPALKHPAAAPSPATVSRRPRQKRKPRAAEEARRRRRGGGQQEAEPLVSNKCVLELGEDHPVNLTSDGRPLVCTLCPPPGRSFKRASGLAVHLKLLHLLEGKKTFFCATCKQKLRTQVELDAHTKRHANQNAVFSCVLCPPAEGGFGGSKWGLKRHLQQQHPGVVPRCDICNKGFTSLASYLADQFRHVGVSPFFCTRCRIYEMTERGLHVHIRNHDRKKKKKQQQQHEEEAALSEPPPQTLGVSANPDNSATDDSDF